MEKELVGEIGEGEVFHKIGKGIRKRRLVFAPWNDCEALINI